VVTKERAPTAIRFTEEDRDIIAKLERLTGLEGMTAVVRLSLRETLALWEKRSTRKK
jgi:hypothetical protein